MTRGIVERLGLTRETFAAARELTAALAREAMPEGVTPPARSSYATVTPDQALTLSDVYRAMTIHATAASQLELVGERAGRLVPLAELPLIARQPDVDCEFSTHVEQTVLSLTSDGNAFWRVTRRDDRDPLSPAVNARVLPAQLVAVHYDEDGRKVYDYAGEPGHPGGRLQPHQVRHMKLLDIPGRLRGLGPIQAAQVELRGALQLRDYSSLWFDPAEGAAMPNATLNTDQPLTPKQAGDWAEAWHAKRDHRVRVLGSGLKFQPNLLSPKDAQFLESRQFTVPQLARLFGLPASLMLAVLEGNSQSYANVEQDWIAYTRFSLTKYLLPMQGAWSSLLPRGLRVRFDPAGLLRSDTLTRYQGYQLAVGSWLTVNEIRAAEGRAPLAGGDVLAKPAPTPATTPTPEEGATEDA